MKKSVWIVGACVTLFSAAAFAQSGEITIPGYGSAKGSVGTKVKNSHINVVDNKSTDVKVGGGEAGGYGVSVAMKSVANVNSVNALGAEITDSHINVRKNESKQVNVFGGVANVNSVNLQ